MVHIKKTMSLFLVSLFLLVSCTSYKSEEFSKNSYYLNNEESIFVINDIVIESYRGMVTHIAYNSPMINVKDDIKVDDITYDIVNEEGLSLVGARITNGIVRGYRYLDYSDITIQLEEISSKNIKMSDHYYLKVEYLLDSKAINESIELQVR